MMEVFKFLCIVFAIVWAMVSCNQSDWYQEKQRSEDAQRAAQWKSDSTPHVVREADGCKVYAFKSAPGERFTYFTRCSNSQTSTETSWEECRQSGKQRVCENRSTIVEGR